MKLPGTVSGEAAQDPLPTSPPAESMKLIGTSLCHGARTWKRYFSRSFAALTLFDATASILQAQTAGILDPAFNPIVVTSEPVLPLVSAVAIQPDGKLLLGGHFSSVNGQPRNRIARLNANSTVESTATFNPGSGPSGTYSSVQYVMVQTDGKILLAGRFTSVDGQPRNGIARLNANGTLESIDTFNPGTGVDGSVCCVALQADGKILLGGYFTSVNGQPRNRIARLLPDGTLESTLTFNPGTGPNDGISAIAVQADGKILLGGGFTHIDNQSRRGIARLNADGTLESTATFNSVIGPEGTVSVIAFQADGKILIGGDFTSVGEQPRSYIARLDPDGTVEGTATFHPNIAEIGTVYSIAVQADGKVLLGDDFYRVHGQARNYVSRLNLDGSVENAATFNSDLSRAYIESVTLQADGKIVITGDFNTLNGQPRSGIARFTNGAATKTLTIPNTLADSVGAGRDLTGSGAGNF